MLALAGCRVDLERGRVQRPGADEEHLTTKELDLLRYLAANADRDLPRAELLTEVWGYRAASRTIDTTVKTLRRKIEADPSRPVHLLTVHGTGYRWVSAVPRPTPADDGLVGRNAELEALHEALRPPGALVSLVGTAGAGKTRLAQRVRGEDTVWVALGAASDADGVLAELAAAAGVRTSASGDPIARASALGAQLAPVELVVLDEAEAVTAALEELLPPLRAAAGGTRWLVTTRQRLAGPDPVLEVSGLPLADAVQLFRERARDEGADCEQLVQRLDGLPLAIELAAARAGLLSPATMAEGLDRSLDVLSRARRRDRRDAMAHTLAWSWDLLDAQQRDDLAAIGAFVGTFDLRAAEAVLGGRGMALLDRLQALVDASLLRRVGDRLDTWTVVRTFARDQLDSSGRAAEVDRRHARWCLLAAAESAPNTGPEAAEAARRLRWELLAAIERASDDDALLSELVEAVAPSLMTRGSNALLLRILGEAIGAATRAGDRDRAGRLALVRAWTRVQVGDGEGAEEELWAAAPLVDHDRGQRSDRLRLLARIRWAAHDPDGARGLLAEAAEAAGDDPVRRPLVRSLQGALALGSGDRRAAATHLAEAAAEQRRTSELWGLAETLALQAELAREAGEAGWTEAGEVLRIGRALDEAWTRARGLALLAAAHLDAGDLEAARAHAEEARADAVRSGNADTLRRATLRAAEVALHADDLPEVDALLEAVGLPSATGRPDDGDVVVEGRLWLARGRPGRAVEVLERGSLRACGAWLAAALRASGAGDQALRVAQQVAALPLSAAAAGVLAVVEGRALPRAEGWQTMRDGLPAEVRLALEVAR
ncbi:MAG: winged helix-turn-helix domain-containing protein [Alphaproteobacteria bacterium]|nr:winged helix-turn-helix domain-containing protein [Alphaproteobacteria bacterium]